ncbi:MAG: HD domain-containing protein [Candidatus Omnitrophica bacterium]|nr:HD domain-containing protein [Candidatus Omnitrophota bacterium]
MTLAEALSQLQPVLARVEEFARRQGWSCFLVGGFLRDQLLGRDPAYVNADLAVNHPGLDAGRRLADLLGGTFIALDEAAGSARVVVGQPGRRVELDVNQFRGPTLEADLGLRDFTLNAMAVSLADWLRRPHAPQPLIDPLGGRDALARGLLRPCFDGAFEADPVRILRAYRFAAQLGVTLEASADPLIRQAVPGLARVSGERIRDEFLLIFETDRAAPAARALEAAGALEAIIPELGAGRGMDQGPFHHLDVLAHQLEAVAQADRILADFAEFSPPLRPPLGEYCAQQLVERRTRKALIKLGALVHDVGKPSNRQVHPDGEIWFLGHEEGGAELTEEIARRLRLSNRESQMVWRLVRHHLRPGFLSREPQLTRRAVYRFFKDLEDDGPACLLTWWSDRMATRGPQSRLDQVDQQRGRLEELLAAYFFKAEEVVKPPRLVDGRRLMQELCLPPGPAVGQLLAAIEEAQAEGRVRTADEALALARELRKTAQPNPS